MKLRIAVAAVVPLLVGCGVDRGERLQQNVVISEQNVARGTYTLGTEVTSRGAVPQDAEGETFTRGDVVFLSVDLNGTSTDPVIEVKWMDPHGQIIRREAQHPQHGTRYVPFSSGVTARWSRGAHRAVILIDGRRVSEKLFELL